MLEARVCKELHGVGAGVTVSSMDGYGKGRRPHLGCLAMHRPVNRWKRQGDSGRADKAPAWGSWGLEGCRWAHWLNLIAKGNLRTTNGGSDLGARVLGLCGGARSTPLQGFPCRFYVLGQEKTGSLCQMGGGEVMVGPGTGPTPTSRSQP